MTSPCFFPRAAACGGEWWGSGIPEHKIKQGTGTSGGIQEHTASLCSRRTRSALAASFSAFSLAFSAFFLACLSARSASVKTCSKRDACSLILTHVAIQMIQAFGYRACRARTSFSKARFLSCSAAPSSAMVKAAREEATSIRRER